MSETRLTPARKGARAYFNQGRCSGHAQFNGRYCRDTAEPDQWCINCAGFMLLAEVDRLTAQAQAFGDVRSGDVIRYPLYMFGHEYDAEERTVEMFRGCLGVFRSGNDRTAGRFTPLCELYKPGPESKQGYIPNYGEYQTGPMVPVWTVVTRLEQEP